MDFPPDSPEREAFKEQLKACIPLQSMIIDLWDWDLHFEEELGEDWFFEAASGEGDSLEYCADVLQEFFLESCMRFGIDYDQAEDDPEFEAMVLDNARKFIHDWRTAVAQIQLRQPTAG